MDQEQRDIERRQKAILEDMGRIRVMRRGTLSQQRYAQRQKRKGGQGACGPYFVWQGFVKGQHFGRRVSADQAQTMKEEIEARQRFERLCSEYIGLAEVLAERKHKQGLSDEGQKKGLKSRSNRVRK